MMETKGLKRTNFGFLSLLCLMLTFFVIGLWDAMVCSFMIFIALILLFLSVVLAIAGLASKNQNKKNNVCSAITLMSIVGIFVLGMM